MRNLRTLTFGLVALGAAAAIYRKMSETRHPTPALFIDAVTMRGLAEIEAARLALEKTASVEVKSFAQKMIEDHLAVNQELKLLASTKGYDMSAETDLLTMARDALLNLRAADPFDIAYAEHQVASHKKTIALLQKGARMDDFDLSNFSRKSLMKMEHHLTMSQALLANLQSRPSHKPDSTMNTITASGTTPPG